MSLIIDQSLAWASCGRPCGHRASSPPNVGQSPVEPARPAEGSARPGVRSRVALARVVAVGHGAHEAKKEAAHEGAAGSVVGVREASHKNGGTSPRFPRSLPIATVSPFGHASRNPSGTPGVLAPGRPDHHLGDRLFLRPFGRSVFTGPPWIDAEIASRRGGSPGVPTVHERSRFA